MIITKEIALNYLNRGFSIFPVNLVKEKNGKITKKPAVPWKEYINRLPTREEVEVWFGSGKHNGIGVATGEVSGVVVLDVEFGADPKIVEKYKSPLSSKTISGGWHFYFRANEELRNAVRIDDELVDFRGDGGFVVLPPSGIGDNNYSWHNKTSLVNLPPLPYDIVKYLEKKDEGLKKPVFDFNQDYPYPDGNEGARNDTLARVAGSVIMRLPRNQWDVMGWATVVDWNEHHCFPPLSEDEVRATWESIKTTHNIKNPQQREVDKYQILTGEHVMSEYRKLEAKYGEGITTGIPEIDDYFHFLPQQLYLVSAPTHQGKTTFTLNMASKVASFGYKVLFASLEQGIFIAPRVESMVGKFPENLSVLTSNELLTVPGIIEAVNGRPQKPELIIIDHLHFVAKDPKKNKTDAIDDMMLLLQNMAKQLEIPVVVIAHMRKLNADRAPELDDLRDSSSLSQIPSVIMMIHRKKNDSMDTDNSFLEKTGRLYIAKNRLGGKTGSEYFELKDSGEFVFGNKYQPAAPVITKYKPKLNAKGYNPYGND